MTGGSDPGSLRYGRSGPGAAAGPGRAFGEAGQESGQPRAARAEPITGAVRSVIAWLPGSRTGSGKAPAARLLTRRTPSLWGACMPHRVLRARRPRTPFTSRPLALRQVIRKIVIAAAAAA